MIEAVHHLATRALAVANEEWKTSDQVDRESRLQALPVWGTILLVLTTFIYIFGLSIIGYVYGQMLGALTIIESPTTAVYVPVTEEKDPSHGEKGDGHVNDLPEALLLRRSSVLGNFRMATRYLKAQTGTGTRAMFRGLRFLMLYNILHRFIVSFFGIDRLPYWSQALVFVTVSVLLCQIHLAWTHSVISRANDQSLSQRIQSASPLRSLLLPTCVWAAAKHFCFTVPFMLLSVVIQPILDPLSTTKDKQIAMAQACAVFLIFLGTVVVILIPAHVTLIRTEASLLPANEETIVPFDRTFDGALPDPSVPSEAQSPAVAISMLQAWKSFDKSARLRLIKLYIKVAHMQIVATILFVTLILAELKLIWGEDFCQAIHHASEWIQHDILRAY